MADQHSREPLIGGEYTLASLEPREPDVYMYLVVDRLYELDLEIFGPDVALSKKYLRDKMLRNKGNLVYATHAPAAQEDFFQSIIGYGLATLGYDSESYKVPSEMGYIAGIAVHPEHRRKKVALHLRESILQHCFEQWGVGEVRTTARSSNVAMIEMNKKMGAKVLGSLGSDMYADNEERIELAITWDVWVTYATERGIFKRHGYDNIDLEPGVMPIVSGPKPTRETLLRYGEHR